MLGFRATCSLRLEWSHGGPTQGASLPVPVKRGGQTLIAALQIDFPVIMARPGEELDREEARRIRNEISPPQQVAFVDPRTGELSGKKLYMNEPGRVSRYGIEDPASGVVGRFDDPAWLPRERREAARQRLCAALDVLLPMFEEGSALATEEARRAAGEVRELFPVVAEPGLWPYYRAEGRELFEWLEGR